MKKRPLKEAIDLYKEGEEDLKTGLLRMKFKPDYLSAVHNFGEAAKIFEENQSWKQAIQAYEQTIKCNKKLLESWAEAQNNYKLAEIYIFQLEDLASAKRHLQEAIVSYKLSGKYQISVKAVLNLSDKIQENYQNLDKAKIDFAFGLMKEAWEDSIQNTHDDLVKVGISEIFSKLLDVACAREDFNYAVTLTKKYIDFQSKEKDCSKYTLVNTYAKLIMIRLIQAEMLKAEEDLNSCDKLYDSSCGGEIEDIRKLFRAFREANEKTFNFQITYAYHLFERHLIKFLKIAFNKNKENPEKLKREEIQLTADVVEANLEAGEEGNEEYL